MRIKKLRRAGVVVGLMLLIGVMVFVLRDRDERFTVYVVVSDVQSGYVSQRTELPTERQKRNDAIRQMISEEFAVTRDGTSHAVGTEIGIHTRLFGYYIKTLPDGQVELWQIQSERPALTTSVSAGDQDPVVSFATQLLTEKTDTWLHKCREKG